MAGSIREAEGMVLCLPVTSCHQVCTQGMVVALCRAGKQLAELALKQRVSQGLPFMRGIFDKHQQHMAAAVPATDVPPAQRPFPWEKSFPDE